METLNKGVKMLHTTSDHLNRFEGSVQNLRSLANAEPEDETEALLTAAVSLLLGILLLRRSYHLIRQLLNER